LLTVAAQTFEDDAASGIAQRLEQYVGEYLHENA
jgi:hypothetical protein